MGCKALVINRDCVDGSISHEIFTTQAYKRSFRTGDLSFEYFVLLLPETNFFRSGSLALYKIEFKL